MVLNVLDIDLDVFVSPIHYGLTDSELRLSCENHSIWEIGALRQFLEKKCLLSIINKTKGLFFRHHLGMFSFLRDKVIASNGQLTFDIDHIDAHSDMGAGDDSLLFICTELLRFPVDKRYFMQPNDIYQQLCSGNYLLYCLACRFINSVNFIMPEKTTNLHPFFFHNLDVLSGYLQLKQMNKPDMEAIFQCNDSFQAYNPINYEPRVPYQKIDIAIFQSTKKYDYVCVTLSPGFTPPSIDKYIPIIGEYLNIL